MTAGDRQFLGGSLDQAALGISGFFFIGAVLFTVYVLVWFYSGLNKVRERGHGLDDWLRWVTFGVFNKYVRHVFGDYERGVSPDSWEGSVDGLVKLMETIKLVTVFLMVLAPETLLDYTCVLPATLADNMGFGGLARLSELPCKTGPTLLGAGYYAQFHARADFNATQTQDFEDLSAAVCASPLPYYFYAMLVVEALSLLYIHLLSKRAVYHARKLSLLFFFTAAAWGVWPLVLTFRYGRLGLVCTVVNASRMTCVFSAWYSCVAGCLFFAHWFQLLAGVGKAAKERFRAESMVGGRGQSPAAAASAGARAATAGEALFSAAELDFIRTTLAAQVAELGTLRRRAAGKAWAGATEGNTDA